MSSSELIVVPFTAPARAGTAATAGLLSSESALPDPRHAGNSAMMMTDATLVNGIPLDCIPPCQTLGAPWTMTADYMR